MLSRTHFSSYAISTNGFSENNSEAFLGLWDPSSVTHVAQFWRLLLILGADVCHLGYKFSHTSGDKVLSKSTESESGSSGKNLQGSKGDQWLQSLHQGCSGWCRVYCRPAGLGTAWHSSEKKQTDSQPDSWLLGLVLHPQGQTSSGKAWKLELCLPDCSFFTSSLECVPCTGFLTWGKKKPRRMKGSLISSLSLIPLMELITYGEDSSFYYYVSFFCFTRVHDY